MLLAGKEVQILLRGSKSGQAKLCLGKPRVVFSGNSEKAEKPGKKHVFEDVGFTLHMPGATSSGTLKNLSVCRTPCFLLRHDMFWVPCIGPAGDRP